MVSASVGGREKSVGKVRAWTMGLVVALLPPVVAAVEGAGLAGSRWQLEVLVSNGAEDPPPAPVSLVFGEETGVTGNAGVNDYVGRVSVAPDGALRWTARGLAMTRKAGPPEVMQFEARYLHALMRSVRAVTDAEGRLVLDDGPGEKRLVYRRE
jgi:heat shock protein HslJ